MQAISDSGQKLLRKTSRSFGDNINRVMLVSGESDDGGPKKLTQQKLASRSGVGRSTIAKYNTMKDDSKLLVNPDLETICRLADAVNVSPAFLLMNAEDWSRMVQAAVYLCTSTSNGKVNQIAEEISDSSGKNAIAMSLVGLNLATIFGVYKNTPQSTMDKTLLGSEIKERNAEVRAGILATSALPPLAQLNKSFKAPLLSLCAIMGAHPKSIE